MRRKRPYTGLVPSALMSVRGNLGVAMKLGFGRGRVVKLAQTLCALIVLASCTNYPVMNAAPETDVTSVAKTCCIGVDRYPDPIIAMIEPKADRASIVNDAHYLRQPYLKDKPEAWEFVQRHLRPMDILLTNDRSQINGYFIPGYFKHSLVYLGTEEQLRAHGLWQLSALDPHRDKIRNGQVFYESTPPRVMFSPVENILDVDGVGVFRPNLTQVEKRQALQVLMAQWDKPFDMHMDLRTQDCLFCAELVNLAMPGLKLPQQRAYGRPLIVPDAIAAHGLVDPSLTFIGFVAAGPNWARSLTKQDLAETIKKHWPRPEMH